MNFLWTNAAPLGVVVDTTRVAIQVSGSPEHSRHDSQVDLLGPHGQDDGTTGQHPRTLKKAHFVVITAWWLLVSSGARDMATIWGAAEQS